MSEIAIVERESKRALVIKAVVGMMKAAKLMGSSYLKVQDYCKTHNISVEEAPFTSYKVKDWEKTTNMGLFKGMISMLFQKWDMEMGYVIDSEHSLQDAGEIEAIEIPAGKYIEYVHVGPYYKVGETYKLLYAYAKENNLTLGDRSIEFYLNDPREVDQSELETKVLIPLV